VNLLSVPIQTIESRLQSYQLSSDFPIKKFGNPKNSKPNKNNKIIDKNIFIFIKFRKKFLFDQQFLGILSVKVNE
jgi:hypothetical protein